MGGEEGMGMETGEVEGVGGEVKGGHLTGEEVQLMVAPWMRFWLLPSLSYLLSLLLDGASLARSLALASRFCLSLCFALYVSVALFSHSFLGLKLVLCRWRPRSLFLSLSSFALSYFFSLCFSIALHFFLFLSHSLSLLVSLSFFPRSLCPSYNLSLTRFLSLDLFLSVYFSPTRSLAL